MPSTTVLGVPTPWIALGGSILFALLAFGLRSLLHYRRTGRTGWVGLSGNVGSFEWIGGVLFAVALVASAAAPLLQVTGAVAPLPALDVAAAHGLGIALCLVGTASTLWAQLAMGDSWRIGVDGSARTTLVVAAGPFRWVRNPIFTGMMITVLGLALLVPNVVALVGVAVLLLALQIQVRRVEEPYLVRNHGGDYLRYASRTGRFLPGVGRLRRTTLGERRTPTV